MRSRAVRRLKEPARWVPEAVQAMLFTHQAPPLSLLGSPRPQRPAYEEPVEARTLPQFIETPTTTAEQKQKSAEKFVTLQSDAEQSTTRQRQEEIPRGQSQRGFFSFVFFKCRRHIDACS